MSHFYAALATCVALVQLVTTQIIDLYPLANERPITEEDFEMGNIPKRLEAEGPRDCSEILNEDPGAESGVYTIYPTNCNMCYYNVYCDMDNEGGGWTVIAKRFNGTLDFYRGWYFYKMGFGNVFHEHYLGNERIHQITTYKPFELKICLTDVGEMETVAGYSHFYLRNESTGYALHIDSYYGDAEDYMVASNRSKFSTFDMDNDGAPQNCAKYFHSAWWYHTYGAKSGPEQKPFFSCGSQSNLFGYYFLGRKELPHFAGPGLSWKPVPGPGGPAIKAVTFKIRPQGYLGGSRLEGRQGGGRIVRAAAKKS